MKSNKLSFRYSLQMLPVIIKALQEKRAGLCSLSDFLENAWNDLREQSENARVLRDKVIPQTISRFERLSLGRYFDLTNRYLRSYRLALELLDDFLEYGGEHALEKSLRQFETGRRFEDSLLKMRMDLAPAVCERISRAC